MTEAPKCDICGHEKVQLVERTEQAREPIFVCAYEPPGRKKMPCDGYVAKIANRRI